MHHTGDETFYRRLIHSIAVTIVVLSNFVAQLKSFIANVMKCKARLKKNSNVYAYVVFLSDESLLMLLNKTKVRRLIKVFTMFILS